MKSVLSLLILIGLATPIFALHEIDHRFTVLGHVRDGQGVAKAGIVVTLEHKGGVKQRATTNSSGYYESVFHLHDEDLGDEIIVTAGAEVKRIVTVFELGNKQSVRQGQVDFGAQGKESPALYYWLGGGGVLLLCAAIYFSLIKKKKQVVKKEKRKK